MEPPKAPRPRAVIGISGASGAVYGVRLPQRLRVTGFETLWVASPAEVLNAHHELGLDRAWLERRADQAHNPAEIGDTIAGGSFTTQAVVVAPVRDGQRQR